MQTCPACAQENPDGFRLCGMCGTALTAAPEPAREERKVVTVLFTDLVGSTAAAERLDPEDVRKILSPYYARLRAEIERHGGTVEKFIGDAVMAVFGAPVAHEDDPERAVRAALAIRDAVSGELQIRTAVNTGEALVALGARPVEGEGMVSGDVVNTAARLQGAAPVNGILVGETTYRATRDRIEYREAKPVVAKGKSEPIPVWEVVGAHAAFGSDVEERLRTPLVGRSRERALLADALGRARTEQSVQLVTLVGVPGIGKSRLVAELFQIVDAEPDLIAWRQGRSLPYGESLSFWALGEIVKAHAGVLESDDADAAAAKLAATVAQLAEDERERDWIERHVRPLVGLGAGEGDRAEAFAAWRRLLELAAEQRPLVLVFEDLHWADDGLLDFVDHLVDWATTVPLLVVATARPELLDRRPGWGGGKRNAFTLSIGALTDDETAQLLHALLERAVLPADVQRSVVERAEGNPLYAAEYARMLQEHEGGDLPLPDSVQGLIAARIDALRPEEKTHLQNAAVVGKVFWPGTLGEADPDVLHALERKEFIRRDRRSSIAGETQYAFLHALVRDVAYGQIPRPQRVERHRAVAEWIGGLTADRSEDRSEMLAHHYRQALQLASSAGIDAADLHEPAKRALADAASRALALYAWGSAAELAEAALELAVPGDPLRPQLQLTLAAARLEIDKPDLELTLAARDGFEALGDVEGAVEAEILATQSAFLVGLPGIQYAQNAVDRLAGRPPSELHARAAARLARRLTLGGSSAAALQIARDALPLAERFADERTRSDLLNTIGISRGFLGDEGGIDDLHSAIAIAERTQAVRELSTAYNNLANTVWKFGRLEEGAAALRAARDLVLRYGSSSGLLWSDAEMVYEAWLRGALRESFDAAAVVIDRAHERYNTVTAVGVRAFALATYGELDEALELVEGALARAREVGDPQVLSSLLGLCSYVHYCRVEKAAAIEKAAEMLANDASLHHELWVWHLPLELTELGRGDLYLDAARRNPTGTVWQRAGIAAASAEFARAADLYAEIGTRFSEAWARLLAAEHGDVSHLDRARAYFEAEHASAFVERCEAVLRASA